MTIYADNINYLKTFLPHIHMLVHSQSDDYTLVSNVKGSYNCMQNKSGLLLYSKYDPVYEAERWFESLNLDEEDESDIILFGLGLTYHLKVLFQNCPNRKLIIYEPDISIFMQMMKIVNLSDLYAHPNVKYIGVGHNHSSMNDLYDFVKKYCTLSYSYIRVPIYDRLHNHTQKKFLENLKELDLERKSILGFQKTFGKMMYHNTLKNIPKLINTPSIKTLEGVYSGCTAVVVGGGPSLQHDISILKEKQNKWLIIAAGSSVQSLVHLGVIPHLIVSMDPGIFNANIFKQNSYLNIPLLMMPQIHHEIPRIHDINNVYAYYSNDPIINYFIPYDDVNFIMKPTYSVTGTAIQAAIYLGCNRVLLTGQDLSYPGKQQYSPGAKHISKHLQQRKDDEFVFEVKNVNGTTNPTSFSMLQTLKDIEQLIANITHTNFINCSSLGAVIEGTIFMNIGDVPDEDTVIPSVPLSEIIENSPIFHKNDKRVLVKKTMELLFYLDNLIVEIKNADMMLSKLVKANYGSREKMLKCIKKFETRIQWLLSSDKFNRFASYWFTVEINNCQKHLLPAFNENQLDKKVKIYSDCISPLLLTIRSGIPKIKEELSILIDELNKQNG